MSATSGGRRAAREAARPRRRHTVRWVVLALVILLVACVAWIGVRAYLAKNHLETSVSLATTVQKQIVAGDAAGAQATAKQLSVQAGDAHRLTSDPVWRAAEILPLAGPDLRAVRQVSAVLSDVADHAVMPVTTVASTIQVSHFKPAGGAIDLHPLTAAQPPVARAAADLRNQLAVARAIDTSHTVSQVTSAVGQLVTVLGKASGTADEADHALTLLPQMLGSDGARNYLILFQNNAESRSTGGIPGALAEIRADRGRISLVRQASSTDFPQFPKPVLKLPTETEGIYGSITGEYIQDVTLTPRFDLTGELAREMWRQHFGTTVDGVLSVDPVALSYLIGATGPIALPTGETLTTANTVQTLLSDSYAKYQDPAAQDAFFGGAAAAVFQKVASGSFDPAAFLAALTRATTEHRLMLWSAHTSEQTTVAQTALSGALPVSTAKKPVFGVYLNDSTGSKMDYYLKTQISVGQQVCRKDGRPDWVVEVSLTNTAPADAATSLPAYVTGGGLFGTPPGIVATTVSVYAPSSGVFTGAAQDGSTRSIHTATDGTYPVAQFETRLSPGKTTTWRISYLGGSAKSQNPSVVQTPAINVSDPKKLLIDCETPLN